MRGKFFLLTMTVAITALASGAVQAQSSQPAAPAATHQYNEDEDANIMKGFSYVLSPIGFVLEWGLARPLDYLAHRSFLAPVLGGGGTLDDESAYTLYGVKPVPGGREAGTTVTPVTPPGEALPGTAGSAGAVAEKAPSGGKPNVVGAEEGKGHASKAAHAEDLSPKQDLLSSKGPRSPEAKAAPHALGSEGNAQRSAAAAHPEPAERANHLDGAVEAKGRRETTGTNWGAATEGSSAEARPADSPSRGAGNGTVALPTPENGRINMAERTRIQPPDRMPDSQPVLRQ